MSDDDTCPVCGQPYDYKRTEKRYQESPTIRDDAAVCKTALTSSTYKVYLHFPHLRTESQGSDDGSNDSDKLVQAARSGEELDSSV